MEEAQGAIEMGSFGRIRTGTAIATIATRILAIAALTALPCCCGFTPTTTPLVQSQRQVSEHSLTARSQRDDHDPFGDYSYDDSGVDQSWDTPQSESPSVTRPLHVPTSHFFSKKSLQDPAFRSSNVFDKLCKGAGITRPSRIQSLAWPVLSDGKHCIVADQTGSGKTLAYLLPLLQRALYLITRDGKKGRPNGAPRLMVLAPTAELADQVHAVCRKLSQQVPFKAMVVTASGKYATSIRDQIRMLQRQPVDVLISTPGRVATILRSRNSGLDLTSLQSIVLDEVDVLLIDETFGPQLRTVGVAAPLERTQFVFVTATLPDTVVDIVEREFPGVVQVRGPGLHRVAPTVKEHLVDVSVPSRYNRDMTLCFDIKAKQLLKALRKHRSRRTLIFCNTVDSCRSVENLLRRNDRRGQILHVGAYHNAMTPENRNNNLAVFARAKDDSHGAADQVLVCTDRAARGVDFDAAPVDHVILFDFPKDPAEYVRRVGRTARAGRLGTSTVFAYGWQLPVARKIMGGKLDSFTVAIADVDGSEEDDEYRGGVQARRPRNTKKFQSRSERETLIKGNIEDGQLWKSGKKRS